MDASRNFRLGLLALLAGGTFLGLLAFVLQGIFSDERVLYFILCEDNVKGMVIGSKVNFQGVPFGAVSDMRFQDGRTLVEISVDPKRAEIQDLTRARLDRLLVTGQVTVELEGYGPNGQQLPPGSFVKVKQDPITRLAKTAPELVPQLDKLIEQFGVLLSEENLVLVNSILKHGDRAAQELPELLAHSAAAAQALERTAERLHQQSLPATEELMAALQKSLADLQTLQAACVGAAQEAQALFGGMRGQTLAMLTSLRSSFDDLRGFARQLRQAPDSLLFGVSRPASPAGGER
jgi:ABC-type transporter Mla subunit MlaD